MGYTSDSSADSSSSVSTGTQVSVEESQPHEKARIGKGPLSKVRAKLKSRLYLPQKK